MIRHNFLRHAGAYAIAAAQAFSPTATCAQSSEALQFEVPAQSLGEALREVASRSGRNLVVPSELVAGRRSPPLNGRYSPEDAIRLLLAGTGLELRSDNGNLIVSSALGGGFPEGRSRTSQEPAIVVTGSRIRGAGPVGSNLIVIDRTDIDRSGYATTHQILQSLPQNFGGGPNEGSVGISLRNNTTANSGFGSSINLRGLGSASTLVLVNGHRPALGGLFGAFSDMSLIPSTAIERIEILGDGASAIYGSDAVAGVVNIRLRSSFEGAETRARYGFANGFDEAQASQLVGIGWRSGHALLAYEYYQRGRLSADDRDYATDDLRPFGGPDYRKSFSNPGTIIASDGRVFGIPAGQNGTDLAPNELLAGQPNLRDGRIGTDLLPRTRRHALYAGARQDLGSWLSANVEGFFADRRSSTRFIPDNYGGVFVPTINPFYVDPIGTHQPIMVNYDFTEDLGQQTARTHVRAYSGIASLEAKLGRWSAVLHGSLGEQTENLRSENLPNYYNLALALADPDPATAYNLFGDGSFTNPATLKTVRGYVRTKGRFRLWSTGGKLDGPLFRLPGGDVKLAFGLEYRNERYGYETIDYQFRPTPTLVPLPGVPIGRSIKAGFAELFVPLVGPDQHIPLMQRLDLSLAARIEDYSDFGTTTNPKAGIRWTVAEGLVVRGTFGSSFRAPGFQDIRQGPGTSLFLPQPLSDPASPTGMTNALILFGNRPAIGPERAQTWTAGVDLAPPWLPGFRAALTYFDISFRERIASLAAGYLTFLGNRSLYQALIEDDPGASQVSALYADPSFINPYGIPQSEIEVLIDARTGNLASLNENGLDFDVAYRAGSSKRALEAGLSGTYIFGINQRIAPSAPASDVVSTLGNPVDLRLRGRLVGSLGPLSAAAFVNFIDGYKNVAVLPAEPVESWTTVDLRVGWEPSGPLAGLRLALSISNLFDSKPPYVNNPTPYSAAGFDPENASPVGRLFAFQVTKTW